MTGHTSTKVRLVKCPRCQLLLPELPDIPVYMCGGCNTVLQAKQRTPETKEAGIQSPRTDGNRRKETDDISCFSHSIKDAPVSREESSARANSKSDDVSDRVNGKRPDDEGSSNEVSVSPQFTCENEASSQERIEHMEQLKDNCSSDQDIRERGNADDYCDSDWPQGRRVSDEFPTSMELTCNEMDDSSLELQPGMDIEKGGYDSDHFAGEIEIGRREGKRRYFEGSNFSDISSIMIDSSPEIGEQEQRGESILIAQQNSAGTKLAFHQYEIKSARVEARIEADEELKGHISLKAEDFIDTKESDSIDAPESSLDENFLAESILSSDEQHSELPQKLLPQDLNHASSADSLTNLPEAKSRSWLGARDIYLSKSSTQSYYSCNGSFSSNDEIEEQVPGRFSKPPRRKLKHPTPITSNEPPKQDESGLKDFLSRMSDMYYPGYDRSQVDDQMSNESEVKPLGRKSTFLEANRSTMKHSQHGHGDFPETTSYGQLSGSKMIPPPVQEYVPRFSRDFLAGQRNGAPPSYRQGHSSGFCSPDTQFYSGPDKLELLKMVNELKDELERTRISNIGSPSTFTGERKYTSSIYQQVASAGGGYADFPHSRCPAQYSCMKVLPQAPKMSRVGFSGEAANYRRQGNRSCMHCFPQDYRYSANLPLHVRDEGCCSAQSDHTFDKSSYSTFSSPHRHSRYQFLRDHKTKYDDLRHRENETRRRHLREKTASPKLHVRPAAGGIPILACYHCSELLHLPADFLLSGRRIHRLKCSACGKIMNISLESGRHLVPCIADTIALPPNMVAECSYSLDRTQWASPSYPKKYPDGEPVSCSADRGLSYDRSYTMEGEGLINMPPQTLKYPPQNKTSGAFDPIDHQKVNSVSRQPQLRHKNSVENIRLAGPSSTKSKGKLKEHGLTPGSTLHQLMGYSSPSKVIRS